jgi:hypothetical protein
MKYGKIRPKRTGDDRGSLEIWNTEIRPVLVINRSISTINRRGDLRTNFVRNRVIFAENR